MGNIRFQPYHSFIDGILTQAFELDYDVAFFTPFTSLPIDTGYQNGENLIYSLARYGNFDAVLYLPCTYMDDKAREPVEHYLDELCQHIPVIALESDDPRWHNVPMDDFHAFARVVDHVIDVHHCKKIYCLTGFQGILQAEERQRGYRHSMERHGLEVKPEYVIYGDFWKPAAEKLAEDIATERLERPEAVVVGCDTSAIALTNRLIELGVRVPEDVLVLSYDACNESEENVPSITSYRRPSKDLGIRAVLKAHELLTGQQEEPVMFDTGHLVLAESCGCGKNFAEKFEERQRMIRDVEEYRKLFEETPMAETLNAAQNLHDLLYLITCHFYLINGMTDFYLCLCDQWDDLSKNTDDQTAYDHYTDTMHLCITCYENDAELPDHYPFPLTELLPALNERRPKPRGYFFTPLHFNERCFGYTAITYGADTKGFDSLYHSWIRNVNNALEFMRIRNNFNSINQQLFSQSIRDALTGIYNRQGFNHFAKELFQRAKDNPDTRKFLILAADLDGLKVINDTYGHLEGDNAITVVANALNTYKPYGEICARTGGDEFLVIGAAEYTDDTPQKYIDYINRVLKRYNANSGKPYKVGASVGYLMRTIQPDDDLQTLIDEADARMYEIKCRRKMNRK
ncbi:MAG: GGDEF domain-containing protein [Oscillospiraceae bacterium]|nr:GGDEF domain-containing protein [Oscillospiraceae bacterium]